MIVGVLLVGVALSLFILATPRKRKRGDVLAAIGILALLSLMLFPVFAGNPRRSSYTKCFSNCKQLALASILYSSDHDDNLWPVAVSPDLEPYLKRDIMTVKCTEVGDTLGYAYNLKLASRNLSKVEKPMSRVLLFEADTNAKTLVPGTRAQLPENARHSGKIYVGYVDGHSKALTLDRLSAPIAIF